MEASKRNEDEQAKITWILLYHFDVKKGQMRMELSLPKTFDWDERKVTGWEKRIILEPIAFDADSIEIFPDPEFDPEIEIKIRRKKNE